MVKLKMRRMRKGRRTKRLLFLLIVIGGCIFASVVLRPLSLVYAEVPHLINYQGRLTDSKGVPLNGSYNLTFRIYDAESAGNLLWQETHTGAVIQKGIFSILLGSVTNLDLAFDKQYYLEIKVNDEVMTPRQRIASAGYAIRAEHGVPQGVIVMWSGKIADIPSGWALCDGTNGIPDLRDRFIIGAGNTYNPAATGGVATHAHGGETGSHTLTTAEIPAHSHNTPHGPNSGTPNAWGYGDWTFDDPNACLGTTSSTGGNGGHTHTIASGSSLPPYYALAYLMKL